MDGNLRKAPAWMPDAFRPDSLNSSHRCDVRFHAETTVRAGAVSAGASVPIPRAEAIRYKNAVPANFGSIPNTFSTVAPISAKLSRVPRLRGSVFGPHISIGTYSLVWSVVRV